MAWSDSVVFTWEQLTDWFGLFMLGPVRRELIIHSGALPAREAFLFDCFFQLSLEI